MEITERRSHPRADFTGVTFIKDRGREIPCIAGNLSETGILLYPQRRGHNPDRPVQVVFTLPAMSEWIDLQGRLVREKQRSRRTEWGIEFTDVPVEVQDLLRGYVCERSTESIQLPRAVDTGRVTVAPRPLTKTQAAPSKADQDQDLEIPLVVEEPTPAALEVETSELPTQMTLRDDIKPEEPDVGANDAPTVVMPREVALENEGPTQLTGRHAAAALRDRCRRN